MSEALRPQPRRALESQKWTAGNVTPERRQKLRELGVGEDDQDLDSLLHRIEHQLDFLPRSAVRFREIPNVNYSEFAINPQDDDTKDSIMKVFESIGLFPWYANDGGNAEIVISHPSDIEILKQLRLTSRYATEQFSPAKQRSGEPDVLRVLRDKAEQEKTELPPLRADPIEGFPLNRSEKQTFFQEVVDAPRKEDQQKLKSVLTHTKAPEVEAGSDIPEVDAELREITERFDLGLNEEDEASVLSSASAMPSLKLFPRKYQWDKATKKLYKIRTGSEVTPGQQHRLNMHAKNDARAMRESVEMHIGLVLWTMPALLRVHPDADPDDLFQSGLWGLVRALNRYDNAEIEMKEVQKKKNPKEDTDKVRKGFVGYMLMNIENQMRQHLKDSARVARQKSGAAEKRSPYRKGEKALRGAHPERAVERSELAETLARIGVIEGSTDFALDRFERTYWITKFFTVDPETLDDEAAPHVVDMEGNSLSSGSNPHNELAKKELREVIVKMLGKLTPREERVLRLRFGFVGDESYGSERTLESIGQEFGVTRDRIRQIEAKALRKLKHPARVKPLRSFLDE